MVESLDTAWFMTLIEVGEVSQLVVFWFSVLSIVFKKAGATQIRSPSLLTDLPRLMVSIVQDTGNMVLTRD